MTVFNRGRYDALLLRKDTAASFYIAGRDLYYQSMSVFNDGVWTQDREDEMNRLEQQALKLEAVYTKAANAVDQYLKDCGILS